MPNLFPRESSTLPYRTPPYRRGGYALSGQDRQVQPFWLEAGLDEVTEERVGAVRLGFELGVELHGDEKRMFFKFRDLNEVLPGE